MEVHWPSKSIAFKMGKRTVVIKGDPSLTTAKCSLKTMTKTWDKEDQGFWVEFQNLEGDENEEIDDEISERGDEKGVPMI